MNCKPGDIAVVIGASRFAGRLVEVLYAAPQNDFYLPDGYCHSGSAPNYWVLRTLGSLFGAPTEEHGFLRVTEYGVGADARLRPLRAVPKTFDDSIELNIPA